MCFPFDRNSRAAAFALAAFLGLLSGCATPRGVLFASIDPPRIWPAPPDQPRIRLVGTISGSHDLRAERSAGEAFRAVFRGPRPAIRFSSPHGVSVRSPGIVAVADGTGGAVHIMDLQRRTHRMITGFGEERFGIPLGVAWAGERLFVTDARRGEVIELDDQGGWLHRFGADVLKRPVGIAFSSARNELFVVDGGHHNLIVFSLDGTLLRKIGRRGGGPGEFNFPTHIHAAGDRILVADSGNFRVQLLDVDGRCLTTIGQKGNGAGDFSLPKGVALDRDGHVYVVDAQFENVQVFDQTGQLLMAFGGEGSAPGQFALPAGLSIDDQDRIWVADSANRRLQVFAYMRAAS